MKSIKKYQTCRLCRETFLPNSSELNYELYKEFGFKTRNDFEKHSSRNKNCPAKSQMANNDEINEEYNINFEVKWPPYDNNINNNDDHNEYKDIILSKEKLHNKPDKNGKILWFDESKIAAHEILLGIQNKDVQWISLCAEPGSGKTAVIHKLIYDIMTFILLLVPQENITLTTGMSDTDWYEQTLNNFRLRDNRFLWEELNERNETFCIVHRSNFNKRITHLANNLKKMSNHIFIIDESHFADDVKMTFDKEFTRLGLTEERMKEYNIKIILVSATPDVNLSIFSRENNHKLVILKNGPGYKGFDFYNQREMIKNYGENLNLEKYIRQNYSSPRYHFVRARTQQEKGDYRSNLKEICNQNNWIFIEDDCDNNFYISHENNSDEKQARQNNKKIIITYEEPIVHTFILIKNKYQASKRLKLTKYVGIISEKPSKSLDTSITCNGLIPRFFGYPTLPNFINDEKPIFLCNKKCVDEYLDFVNPETPFLYNGKNYTSRRLSSKQDYLIEKKNTTYSSMNNSTLNTRNYYRPDFREIDDIEKVKKASDILGYGFSNLKKNTDGFVETSLGKKGIIANRNDIIAYLPNAWQHVRDDGIKTWRTYLPYYDDNKNINSLKFILIIRPDTSDSKIKELDDYLKN